MKDSLNFPEFLDIDGVVHHEYALLDRVLLIILQYLKSLLIAVRRKRRSNWQGQRTGFCITMMHITACRLFSSNSSSRKTFLSSTNHHPLRI